MHIVVVVTGGVVEVVVGGGAAGAVVVVAVADAGVGACVGVGTCTWKVDAARSVTGPVFGIGASGAIVVVVDEAVVVVSDPTGMVTGLRTA